MWFTRINYQEHPFSSSWKWHTRHWSKLSLQNQQPSSWHHKALALLLCLSSETLKTKRGLKTFSFGKNMLQSHRKQLRWHHQRSTVPISLFNKRNYQLHNRHGHCGIQALLWQLQQCHKLFENSVGWQCFCYKIQAMHSLPKAKQKRSHNTAVHAKAAPKAFECAELYIMRWQALSISNITPFQTQLKVCSEV